MKTAGIIYTSLETILRKGRKGMLRVPEIELAINVGINNFFEKQLRLFRISGYVPTPLEPLLVITDLDFENPDPPYEKRGWATLPANFSKEVSLYYAESLNTKPADFMNMSEFIDRQTSSILPPTLYNPTATIAGGKLYVNPDDLPTARFTYIKKPTDVVIGTTVSSGRFLIYSDAGTTDTEFRPEYVNDIIKEALLFLSVPEQDEMAAQYGSSNNNSQ